MNTHTPGPWHVVISDTVEIRDDYDGVGARVLSVNPADAPLMAAAPDLLAALEFALRDMESVRAMYEAKAPNVGVLGVSIGLARAAIAKATGVK